MRPILLALPILLLLIPIAPTQELTCPFDITEDFGLNQDLECGSREGIQINANNVELDCNGHTITGGGDYGVRVSGFNNANIKNCNLEGFTTGILLIDSDDSHLTNNQVGNITFGITLRNSEHATLKSNNITGARSISLQTDGSRIEHWVHNIDTSNRIDNLPIIYFSNTRNREIDGTRTNHITIANSTNIAIKNLDIQLGDPISVTFSTGVTIQGNTITQTPRGIYLRGNENIDVSGNQISAISGEAILSYTSTGHMTDNTITNTRRGIYVSQTTDLAIESNEIQSSENGIIIHESRDTRLTNNRITSSSIGMTGIHVSNSQDIDVDSNTIDSPNTKNSTSIFVTETSDIEITGNIVTAETGVSGQDISGRITGNDMTSSEYGVVIFSGRTPLEIKENDIHTSGKAMFITNTNGVEIIRNRITGQGPLKELIYLENTDDSLISENTFPTGVGTMISLVSSDRNTISNHTIEQGQFGISINGQFNTIQDNEIKGLSVVGILLSKHGDSSTITRNTLIGNADGINVPSAHNNIQYNTFQGNTRGLNMIGMDNTVTNNIFSGGDTGISVFAPSTITQNRFDNVRTGIIVATEGQAISSNTFTGCGVGIFTDKDTTAITGNTMEDCSLGVKTSGSRGTIEQNTFTGSKTAVLSFNGNDNTIQGNTFTNNYVSILVWKGRGNRAIGNTINGGSIGIQFDTSGFVQQDNTINVRGNSVVGSERPETSSGARAAAVRERIRTARASGMFEQRAVDIGNIYGVPTSNKWPYNYWVYLQTDFLLRSAGFEGDQINQETRTQADTVINSVIEALYSGSSFASHNAHGMTIDPDFLFAVAMGEGMATYMIEGVARGTEEVNGFRDLGVDTFGGDVQGLRVNGFMSGGDITFLPIERINEKQNSITSAFFPDIEEGLKALGVSLAYRKWLFFRDYERLTGRQASELGEDAINFWNYLYFNPGNGAARNLLERTIESDEPIFRPIQEGEDRVVRSSTGQIQSAIRPAAMERVVGWRLLRDLEIFVSN